MKPPAGKGAKQRHETNLIEYLANPENQFPTRTDMAKKVLGISREAMYQHFNPRELSAIEKQALEIRRTKYAPQIAKVDAALLNRALSGDVQAAKLAYQRFEGWSEKQLLEHKNSEGDFLQALLECFPPKITQVIMEKIGLDSD